MYASPTGLSTNSGLEGSPLDLKTAVTTMPYADVTTVVLKNGDYQMTEDFDFDIGTKTIRAETVFGVRIDVQNFAVAIIGDTGTLEGIIFESSTMERDSEQAGAASPTDVSGGYVAIEADSSLIHSCVFRNLLGFNFYAPAVNSVLYGCHAYYIGWIDPDRGRGHSIYTQNTTGTKTLKRSIFHDSFGWGIHAYSSNGANLLGFTFEKNISFLNGSLGGEARPDILLGADSVAVNGATIRANKTYGGSNGVWFYGVGVNDLTLEDNYCPNGKSGTYTAVSESGNNFTTVGNTSFLESDEHDAETAYLAIYNQANANTVQVDVSAIYTDGDIVNVMNAQDFENDVQALTVISGLITVNMQAINRTVETPIGWPVPATSFPTFGAFILRKQ